MESVIDDLYCINMNPVPRHLFLRDVLLLPASHPDIVKAKAEALQSKWVQEILALQHDDGGFGYFHSLANPAKQRPLTTEQALRRLLVLGLDIGDEPVRRIAGYLEKALKGQIKTPDRVEKLHTWPIYMPLMLAAWLRRLSPGNEAALAVARRWARILEYAFAGETYDHDRYLEAYEDEFTCKPNPKAGRLIDFVHFYPLTLLKGLLKPDMDRKVLSHVTGHKPGIYYILEHAPAELPGEFYSVEAGRCLSALELLAGYDGAGEALAFAADWLMENRQKDGFWDMGQAVKDGVHFPLSDSWREPMDRKIDCTVRVLALWGKLYPNRFRPWPPASSL